MVMMFGLQMTTGEESGAAGGGVYRTPSSYVVTLSGSAVCVHDPHLVASMRTKRRW
jgi:hypothetical protein